MSQSLPGGTSRRRVPAFEGEAGLWTRLRAAPLPFGFTFLCLALALACLRASLAALSGDDLLACLLFTSAGLFWLSATLCSLADAHCRVREYLRIKYLLQTYGFRPRLFRSISRSRCQRDAMLQAARETGCKHELKAFFTSLGYRWYHILPDAITVNPLAFFRLQFLRSTFWPCRALRPAKEPQAQPEQTGCFGS